MQLYALLAPDELHDRRTTPRGELHLQLLGQFVAEGALECPPLHGRQDAIFAAAPAPDARRQGGHSELFVARNRGEFEPSTVTVTVPITVTVTITVTLSMTPTPEPASRSRSGGG